MLVRATRFSLLVIAAVVACGCGSARPYNTPTDESKAAAARAPTRQLGPPSDPLWLISCRLAARRCRTSHVSPEVRPAEPSSHLHSKGCGPRWAFTPGGVRPTLQPHLGE